MVALMVEMCGVDADTNGDLGHCYRPRGLRSRQEEGQTTFQRGWMPSSPAMNGSVGVASFGRT